MGLWRGSLHLTQASTVEAFHGCYIPEGSDKIATLDWETEWKEHWTRSLDSWFILLAATESCLTLDKAFPLSSLK